MIGQTRRVKQVNKICQQFVGSCNGSLPVIVAFGFSDPIGVRIHLTISEWFEETVTVIMSFQFSQRVATGGSYPNIGLTQVLVHLFK